MLWTRPSWKWTSPLSSPGIPAEKCTAQQETVKHERNNLNIETGKPRLLLLANSYNDKQATASVYTNTPTRDLNPPTSRTKDSCLKSRFKTRCSCCERFPLIVMLGCVSFVTFEISSGEGFDHWDGNVTKVPKATGGWMLLIVYVAYKEGNDV